MNKRLGFTALLSSALFYAFFGILIRYSSTSFGTFAQVVLRGLSATILILLWVLLRRKRLLVSPEVSKKRLALYLLSPPISMACATFSISLIKASNTVFFIYAGVIVSSLLFGWFFYRERVTVVKVLTFLIALAGIFLMAFPLEKVGALGLIFGIIPGVLDSLSNAMAKYLGNFDKSTSIFLQSAATTIVGIVLFGLFGEVIPAHVSLASLTAVVTLGLLFVIINALYLYGFKNYDLNLGNIVISAELVILLILNALFLGEFPSKNELFGGLLIVSAVVLIGVHTVYTEKQNKIVPMQHLQNA